MEVETLISMPWGRSIEQKLLGRLHAPIRRGSAVLLSKEARCRVGHSGLFNSV